MGVRETGMEGVRSEMTDEKYDYWKPEGNNKNRIQELQDKIAELERKVGVELNVASEHVISYQQTVLDFKTMKSELGELKKAVNIIERKLKNNDTSMASHLIEFVNLKSVLADLIDTLGNSRSLQGCVILAPY